MPRRSRWRALGRLLIWGGGIALAGCTSPQLPCPNSYVLREAAEVTKLMPGQPADARSVQYVGDIREAKLTCSYDPNSFERLDVALGVRISAERGPAAGQLAAADLRYFVAIVNLEGELLAKKEFDLQLPFPPDGRAVEKIEDIRQTIPLKYPQNGGSLQIWLGFQLSGAELAYNRARLGH